MHVTRLEDRRLFSALPSPWTDSDIGAVGKAGTATVSNSVYTVSGGGADIWNDDDAFNFAYQPLTGNGSIVAEVSSQTNDNAWAKAGVMVRETTADYSRYAILALTPSHGISFQDRTATHTTPFSISTAGSTGVYLKLTRTGSTITGFVSTDGKTFKAFGNATIDFPNTVQVGMAVTAHDNSKLCTATFGNVAVASTGVAASVWNVGTADYLNRWESDTATVNNKVYVFGGYTDRSLDATTESDVYDPSTNAWSHVAPEPIAVTHAGTVAVGNMIYLAGGYEGKQTYSYLMTSTVQAYNTATNAWSTLPNMPSARGAGGMVCINNVLYFYGGSYTGRQTDSGKTWALDLSNIKAGWVYKGLMPDARNHIGYVALDGLAYAIGGLHLGNEVNGQDAEVDVYNPVSDTWTTTTSLPMPWSHFNDSTLAVNGKIVIVGGQTNGGFDGTYLPDIESFTPTARTWTALPPMPEARQAVAAGWTSSGLVVIDGAVDNQGGWPQRQAWVDKTFGV